MTREEALALVNTEFLWIVYDRAKFSHRTCTLRAAGYPVRLARWQKHLKELGACPPEPVGLEDATTDMNRARRIKDKTYSEASKARQEEALASRAVANLRAWPTSSEDKVTSLNRKIAERTQKLAELETPCLGCGQTHATNGSIEVAKEALAIAKGRLEVYTKDLYEANLRLQVAEEACKRLEAADNLAHDVFEFLRRQWQPLNDLDNFRANWLSRRRMLGDEPLPPEATPPAPEPPSVPRPSKDLLREAHETLICPVCKRNRPVDHM